MSRFSERRSNVTPMDFEYTSDERRTPPVWASSQEAGLKRTGSENSSSGISPGFPATPQRPHASGPSAGPGFSAYAQSPTSTPFLFHTSSARMATPPPSTVWQSPSKTDSTNVLDLTDISMEDRSLSPLSHKNALKIDNGPDTKKRRIDDAPSEEGTGRMSLIPTRRMSGNVVRRVYRGRNQAKSKLSTSNKARAVVEEDQEGSTDEYTDEEDDGRLAGMSKQDSITSNHHYTFNMPSVPVSKSEVPYMLLGYVQFFFNLSLVLVFLYILVHCIITIQRDVEHRVAQYRTELAEQMAACTHLYEINKCFPLSGRVPALARQCTEWESCMQRNPSAVGRARVVAETIGEVINSFVEPISWKTLIFGLTSLGFLITLINVLFSVYRARVAPDQMPIQPHPAIRHASMPPAIFPGTPAHSRTYIDQGYGYVDPVPPLRLDRSVDWARSGTDAPARASTPGRVKKRL